MEQERETAGQLNNNAQDEDSEALESNVNSIEVSPLLLQLIRDKKSTLAFVIMHLVEND